MNPQERQMIDDLFGRLSGLENNPRDAEAAAAIAQGMRRAPNAVYALVQTVLVQDEALKRANARIQDLESGGTSADHNQGGFLDTMRDALFGQNPPRSSVPPSGGRPAWNTGQVMGQPQDRYAPQAQQPMQQQPYGQPAMGGGGGGSFLGTAAAAAAGVVGGGLLMSSIRGMMGGGQHGFGDASSFGGGGRESPWSGGSSSNNELARDAGINDIGSSGRANNEDSRSGFFDTASNDSDDFDDDDNDFDGGDFDGGDSDTA